MKKVFLMLAVVAMASCSKSELTPRPEVAGDVEIKAGSSVLSIDTKAPYENRLNTDGQELEAFVYAAENTGSVDYTAATTLSGYMHFKHESGTVTPVGFSKVASGALTSDAKYYPANGNALEMIALAPVNKTASEVWSNASGTVSAVIDGKTDLMTARVTTMDGNTNAINKKNAQSGEHPKFTFDHLLTLVNVKAYASDQAAKDAWGDITEIKLVKVIDATVNNKVSIGLNTFATADPVFANDASASTLLYAYNATDKYTDKEFGGTADATHSGPIALAVGKANAAQIAYSIIAPFKYPASTPKKTLLFEIKTSEVTTAKEVQIETLYTAYTDDTNFTEFTTDKSTKGYQFDIVLNFKATEITASAEVNKWENGGDTGKDVVVE